MPAKNDICNMSFKNGSSWFYGAIMHPTDSEGMANSVDPDQTVPLSSLIRPTLFAQTYLSKYLAFLP